MTRNVHASFKSFHSSYQVSLSVKVPAFKLVVFYFKYEYMYFMTECCVYVMHRSYRPLRMLHTPHTPQSTRRRIAFTFTTTLTR